jgi:hypothetical protein
MSKFLDSFGSPGGGTALVAFMWLVLMFMPFILRLTGGELTPEGIAALGKASDMLLGILVYRLGAQSGVKEVAK